MAFPRMAWRRLALVGPEDGLGGLGVIVSSDNVAANNNSVVVGGVLRHDAIGEGPLSVSGYVLRSFLSPGRFAASRQSASSRASSTASGSSAS